MHAFLEHLKLACQRLRIADCKALVAVSGGADSVALLCGLHALRGELGIEIEGAHLNHQLRGEDAQSDQAWVESLCRQLGVDLITGARPVAQSAEEAGLGLEEAGRAARYEFLAHVARDRGCHLVAVAHTADDLAETVLHHILRGTGLAGLRGMPATRMLDGHLRLARPLLEISKEMLLSYLRAAGRDFREDATNLDLSFTRNRIRHQLLPALREQFNPQVDAALGRLARQAHEAQASLQAAAERLLDRALRMRSAHRCAVAWRVLAPWGRHLVREILAALWRRQEWPRQKMTFEHWQALAEVALCGGAADLPGGMTARRRGKLLLIERQGAAEA